MNSERDGGLTLESVQVGRVRSHGTPGASHHLDRPWSSAFVKEPVRGPIERFPVHPCVRKDRGDGGLPARKKVQEKIQCAHRLLEEFEGQRGANSLTLANTCARPVFGSARVSGFQTRAASLESAP